MVGTIPRQLPGVLTHLVTDLLDAAQGRKYLATGAAVLDAELARESLPIAEVTEADRVCCV